MLAVIAAGPGCDKVLGLDSIHAGLDAAPPQFRCPVGAAPVFSPTVTTLSTSCNHYVTSADTAMAACNGGMNKTLIEQGPVDGPLANAMLPLPLTTSDLQIPRIYPEGDHVIVRVYDTASVMMFSYEAYARTAGGPWTDLGPVAFNVMLPGKNDEVSAPSRAPDRRAIYTSFGFSTNTFYELSEITPTMWQPIATGKYVASDLAMTSLKYPNLTSDGLHLIFTGTSVTGGNGLFIASRGDLMQRFSDPQPITSVTGNVTDAYMTADCAVLYYAVDNLYGVLRAHQ